jgi:hypothetical protein
MVEQIVRDKIEKEKKAQQEVVRAGLIYTFCLLVLICSNS